MSLTGIVLVVLIVILLGGGGLYAGPSGGYPYRGVGFGLGGLLLVILLVLALWRGL